MSKRPAFAIPSLSDMENKPEPKIPVMSTFDQHKSSQLAKSKGSSDSKDAANSVTSKTSLPKSIENTPGIVNTVDSNVTANEKAAEVVAGTSSHIDNSSSAATAEKPSLPVVSSNSLIVSTRQRGNPILKHVRNVPWEFGDIVADYQVSPTGCALFLSLRYHALNPNYIHERLKQLGHSYDLRVLLVQVDVKDPYHSLKELARICILADCTFLLAWTPEEVARYLETYKSFENKPPELIMEKTDTNFLGRVTDTFTAVKKVNKTDAMTLLSTFSSVKGVIEASEEDLALCPGLGPQKAKRLNDIFHEPFLKAKRSSNGTEVAAKSSGDKDA